MRLSSKRRFWQKSALMSDINMTPMIDIMLVLLVIFMITAPMMNAGVKINLPSANAPVVTSHDMPIVVHLNEKGEVFVGDIEIEIGTLPAKLKAIANEADTKIFVKGDKSLPYGFIMDVMGRISSSGFNKVVLVTELPKASHADKKTR